MKDNQLDKTMVLMVILMVLWGGFFVFAWNGIQSEVDAAKQAEADIGIKQITLIVNGIQSENNDSTQSR